MKFLLNGKDYAEYDLELLISYDSVTQKTELQFYRDDGEVKLNNENADISINIDINSDTDLRGLFEGGIGIESSVETSERAMSVLKRELDRILNKYHELYRLFQKRQ